MTVNFVLLALDQLINTAATILHMSGGQFAVPLVIRMTTGAGRQLAAQHSHSLEGWLAHIPGLKILCPATVDDARWMLADALLDPNPVLIFEHCLLFNQQAQLTASRPTNCNSWHAKVRHAGTDISIITYGGMLPLAQKAATELQATYSISAEVIDLRCLRPLDDLTIYASIKKTGKALIIDEGWKSGSLAAELITRIVENNFFDLTAPIARICSAEVPIPYPGHLEKAALPQLSSVINKARDIIDDSI
jgi:pyruvate dehydrogenase E1 component beta subunit